MVRRSSLSSDKYLKAWVDIETTGDDPKRHALIQFSMLVFSGDTLVASHDFNFRPLPGDKLKPKALESTGHNKETLMALDDPYKSFSRLKGTLSKLVDPYNKKDKMLFYAYNAQFDFRFSFIWSKVKMNFPFFGSFFWWPPIDVASIVIDNHPKARSELESFRLLDVADYFNIEVDESKLHNSMYDIELTRAVYEAAKKPAF